MLARKRKIGNIYKRNGAKIEAKQELQEKNLDKLMQQQKENIYIIYLLSILGVVLRDDFTTLVIIHFHKKTSTKEEMKMKYSTAQSQRQHQ